MLIIRFASLAVALLAPAPAHAEDLMPARVGFGAAIGGGTSQPSGSLRLPIRYKRFGLDLEFGAWATRSEDEKTGAWFWAGAASVFATWGDGPTRPVFGVRLGFQRAGVKVSDVQDVSNGVLAGLVFGAEHFLNGTLSLGVEARVTYASPPGGAFYVDGFGVLRVYLE